MSGQRAAIEGSSRASRMSATPMPSADVEGRDHAEGDVMIRVRFEDKGTLAANKFDLPYHAVFEMKGGAWTLTHLDPAQ